jgi:transposase
MRIPAFLPHLKGLRLEAVESHEDGIDVLLTTVRPRAPCPLCRRASRRVHSRYARTVADLPWGGVRVTLRVQARRFHCRHAACPRRVFCERLPRLVRPYGRRTEALRRVLEAVAFALGGRPGARLLPALGLRQSPQVLLRLIRATPDAPTARPRVLGVDDWAMKRGRTYGTLLVDLEQHRPIDVLPDRSAEGFATWLRAGGRTGTVEVIARDRGGEYAQGARQGAPGALQVADRWHLLKNLHDATERLVTRHHRALVEAARTVATARGAGQRDDSVADVRASAPPPDSSAARAGHATDQGSRRYQEQQARRARRLARYEAVCALHAEGTSLRAIARRLELALGTVHRYIRAGAFPEQQPRPRRRTLLTPFEAELRARWDAGCHNGAALWRELRARGFRGGKAIVRERLARWRTTDVAAPAGPGPARPGSAAAVPLPTYSVRQVTWQLLRGPEDLDADEHSFLEALCRHCPDLGVAHGLVQDFAAIVRRREEGALAAWVAVATASRLPDLAALAAGLLRDWAAVRAALTEPWSSGQVEGQVNKLKVLKRQMFGRANVDLLRKRVLYRGPVEPELHQMGL